MAIDGTTSASAATSSDAADTAISDADLFSRMIQGFLTTGMTLGNSIVGDAIDAVNEDTTGS